MKKRFFALLTVLVMLLALSGCGEETDSVSVSPAKGTSSDSSEWAIYWYLCGSNLESEGGCATTDLEEMMAVDLPENVTVVVETGGSLQWQNDFVDASMLQRYVYTSEGLSLVDEQPSANMGSSDTLADFLAFASQNYPADKTAVVFWNHGGGSVAGAAFDELYGDDSLTLDEMHTAFGGVWDLSGNPPLELIGFDTCLMATLDVASTYSDIARYLVASEETEPGNGWDYTGWIGALAEDPSMDGQALGEQICDTYYAGCEAVGTHESATLSLTDLSKVNALVQAYDAYGDEALEEACADTAFFSRMARAAASSENYGGNTREQGYTNMVDMGHLARQTEELMPGTSRVLQNALADCVLYKVNGPYRAESTGLSCYYSYSADIEDYEKYARIGACTAFKYYYGYGLTGTLDENGEAYLAGLDVQETPTLLSLADMGWDNAPLTLDENGNSVLTLGAQANEVLAGIGFQLYYTDTESNTMMLLGTDNDIVADWDNGVFTDNFRGVWGSIDNALVYMELSYEGDDYNVYSVPVLLNGEEYNLQVVYDFTSESWSILGARRGIDGNGMADKELRQLAVGDEITTVYYMASASGDDDFEPYSAETITVSASTAFAEMSLPDGSYQLLYEMRDARGGTVYSDVVSFDCADGEITTSVYES